MPTWSGQLTFNYTQDAWNMGVQLRSFSAFKYDNAYIGPDEAGYDPTLPNSINIRKFQPIIYVNVNASYQINDTFQVYGVINNLQDKDPPYLSLAALNGAGGNVYDWVGMSWKLGLRFDF